VLPLDLILYEPRPKQADRPWNGFSFGSLKMRPRPRVYRANGPLRTNTPHSCHCQPSS
jgi:hypothetical protein